MMLRRVPHEAMSCRPALNRPASGRSALRHSGLWRSVSTVLGAALLAAIGPGGVSQAHATQFGVYEGNGCTGAPQLDAFSRWFGRAPDQVLDFVAFDSWQSMTGDADWTAGCWSDHGHPGLEISLPLTVTGTRLSEVADGRHDAEFRKAAESFIRRGYSDIVMRIGWEANGGWNPWGGLNGQVFHAADGTSYTNTPADYVRAFDHVVDVLRAVPGAHFRYAWVMAQGWQQVIQPTLYPGDAYVDDIGEDIYNQAWGGAVPPSSQAAWDSLHHNYSLDWIAPFAHAHGKTLSIDEWGTGSRPDGHGVGDDPAFIRGMAAYFKANDVAWANYWDYPAPDYNAKVSVPEHDGSYRLPKSGTALIEAFGSSR